MDSLSHSSYLLQQLQEQRIQGLLCDCMLVVKGVCFKAHKNVLAAFSSYFRSLFQNAPSQKSDVFNLVIQDVSGMGQVLDYMYTSHLDVNPDNVHALLDISQCLQVPNVQNMCNSFLKPCPPAVDIPAFPLGGALSSDHNCLLGNTGLPHDVDMQCPPEAHRPLSSDSDQTKRPSSSGDTPLEKQLVHGYKLRNFYSKQYFRQLSSANPGPGPASEEQPVVSNPAMSTATPQGSLTAADNLNSGDSMMSKPVRPKKAVYLKKYNYLRSQKALEEMCAESVSEPVPCPAPTLQERCAVQPVAPPAAAAEHEVAQDTVTEPQPPSPAPVEPEEPPLPAPVPPPTGHRQYCCPDCGKVFKHPSNLELHKRSHTGEKPFQCNVCGRHFSQAGNLQTHLRRHSGEKPYICELCGKGFTAAGDVQRHKVVHSGERPHLCDICGRGFNNLSNLKEHKRTHSTENSFTCDQCGKSFNTHRKLLKHRSRHSGEKPHSCATCGKSFVGSGDLQRHIRSHTGEKPYVCDECGKSFSRSAMLRRHSTTHCRGPQSQSLSSNPQDAGNPPHSSLPKSHSKCPAASGGQTFSSTLPYSGPEKPLPPAHTETCPPRPSSCSSSAAPPHPALPELRSLMPPHLLSTVSQDRTELKVPKPQLPPGFEPCAESGAVKVGRIVAGRPYLPPANTPCTSVPLHGPSISHSPSAPPHGPSAPPHGPVVRSAEGQFMSSVTLWGLAMKTLQNDTD